MIARGPASALAAAGLLGLLVVSAVAAPVDEHTVRAIAADLRCVVCQSLSVADSPSETAHQMRGIIRERLAAGDTPDQVKAYFVDKYGLSVPPRPASPGLQPARLDRAVRGPRHRPHRARHSWSADGPGDRRAGWLAPLVAVDEAMRARITREIGEMDR